MSFRVLYYNQTGEVRPQLENPLTQTGMRSRKELKGVASQRGAEQGGSSIFFIFFKKSIDKCLSVWYHLIKVREDLPNKRKEEFYYEVYRCSV